MAQYKVMRVSPLEKVFPTREPSREGAEGTLSGLRGEIVSFQVAYRDDGWGGLNFARAVLRSPIADWVTVRIVELVPCEYPCCAETDDDYLTTEPGLYPDRLSQLSWEGTTSAESVPLIRGQWRSLWVDIEIPQEAAAGVYPLELALTRNVEEIGAVAVTVEVIGALLPAMQIPHTEWFHSDCLANYYDVAVFSQEYWQIVENFVRTAVKHRCNMLLTPIFTPPLDTAVGGERRTVQLVDVEVTEDGYRFGFANFRRWVEMGNRCGVRYFEMSHLFSQWGATAAPKIMGIKDGVYQRLFGWETDAAGPEYRAFLHAFLTALKEELAALDLRHRVYFHISDEPAMSQMESYRKAREAVAADLQEYPIFDAQSNYEFFAQGLVSCPVCALDEIEPFLAHRTDAPLWGYYCVSQTTKVSNRFIAMPGWRTRVLGAQLYKYRLDGFLQWGFNFYNSALSRFPIDPYRCTDAGRAFAAGDAFLVYPGKDGVPEESLRLMLMDGAMSDLCALQLLERLQGREAALACLEPEGEEILTITKYPKNRAYLTDMRRRVNAAIREAVAE